MLKARRADLSALYRRLCHDGALPGAAAATDAGVALGSFVAAAERGGITLTLTLAPTLTLALTLILTLTLT